MRTSMANLTRRHNSLSINKIKIHVFYKKCEKSWKKHVKPIALHYICVYLNVVEARA